MHTLDRAILASFGGNALNVLCKQFPALAKFIPGRKIAVRNLIENFNGHLKDEMVILDMWDARNMLKNVWQLLVLGSPGSGCSTFLKAIANQRGSFLAVEGDVNYAGIDAASIGKKVSQNVQVLVEVSQYLPSIEAKSSITRKTISIFQRSL